MCVCVFILEKNPFFLLIILQCECTHMHAANEVDFVYSKYSTAPWIKVSQYMMR